MKTHALRALILSTSIAVVLYIAFLAVGDRDAIGKALARFGLWELSLVFGLSLVNYGLRFVRWQWYFAKLGHRLPVPSNLAYYLAGFAFTTTPGKAGEAVRSLYLRAHKVSYLDSLSALFAERFVDMLAILSLAALVAFHFQDYRWLVIVPGAFILAAFLVMQYEPALLWLQRRFDRYLAGRFKTLTDNLFNLIRTSALLLRSKPLYSGFLLGVLAWGAEGLAFYYILVFLDVEITLAVGVGIYAISILAGAVSFIPGGLGSTELVMGLLLLLIGVDASSAMVAIVVCRIATLWFAVALGALTVAWLECHKSPGEQTAE